MKFSFRNRGGRRLALRLAVQFLVLAALAIAPPGFGRAGSSEPPAFSATGGARELKGAPGIYEWSFEAAVGKSPLDKIALHRLAQGPNAPGHPAAVVLYLPGTNMNGEAAIEDPRYSLQVYLAAHGVDVWSLDYRTHFIPPATPQSNLAELAEWTSELFEADIDAAAKFVGARTGHRQIFVAGFSRGAEFAYLYAAMHPEGVQGIVALDAGIPTHPPTTAVPANYAEDVGGAHLTYQKRKTLMQMVIDNPGQPAPIPKYATARENLEHVLYDSGGAFGGHGGLANPQGGFSDVTVLAPLLIRYDRYWPAVQERENPFTPELLAALGASKIPVIAFASTNFGAQWPARVEAAAKSTGAADASFTKFDGWGHLDVLAGTNSERLVFAPTLAFITRHRK